MRFKTVFIGNSTSVYSVAFLKELNRLGFDVRLAASSRKNIFNRRKGILSKIWAVVSNFTAGEIATAICSKLAAASRIKESSWAVKWREKYFLDTVAARLGCACCCCNSINDAELLEKIRIIGPDLILLHSFSEILEKELIDIPKIGCYNFHPGKLPENRGPNPIEWTVLTKQKSIVTDCHQLTTKIDDGDVFVREELSLSGARSWSDVTRQARASTIKCLNSFHDALLCGKLRPLPKDKILKRYNPRPGVFLKYKAHILARFIYRRTE
ncbi:MAG: hypothetical protein A2017_14875 [Lentisphaerae bacterium GWF2_44_16]|nr:MAG: hypothetical protein A2017_14875 [Lentisphaerae bacterium GWF2_44_16]